MEIASSYPESHKFRITLEVAAPHLFTFPRHPGMPPHNNGAELEIRDTAVLHKNVRRQLSTIQGREVFSVLVSVARTCRKLGIFPRTAVECLIKDPDWGWFKPPPGQERQELIAPVAAVSDAGLTFTDNCGDARDSRFGDVSPYRTLMQKFDVL